MAIPLEENLVLSRNIAENARSKDAIISAMIATLRCLSAGVVFVQYVTTEYCASDLYVATCARNRGLVVGVLSHSVKGGHWILYNGAICVVGTEGGEDCAWKFAIIVVFCSNI